MVITFLILGGCAFGGVSETEENTTDSAELDLTDDTVVEPEENSYDKMSMAYAGGDEDSSFHCCA